MRKVKNKKVKVESNLHLLTPDQNVEIEAYKSELDYIWNTNEVKNIALTGDYGSGKSSIIETYLKDKNKEDYFYISLAKYNNVREHERKYANFHMPLDSHDNQENLNSVNNDKEIRKFEGKIINQLLHQLEDKVKSQTSFSIKEKNKQLVKWILAIAIAFCVISMLLLINDVKLIYIYPNLSAITLGVSLVFLICCVYKIIIATNKSNFLKKVTFLGTDIELFSGDTESYFDKYLSEIVFMLKESNKNIVIIEDIDRIEDVKIFERLKEINFLVNKNRKESMKFIYVIREDIFHPKEKTKFFDLIIPIVPVVNGYNSYELMRELLEKNKLIENDESTEKKIEKRKLKEISWYLDDMRLIKNICNETYIYNKSLCKGEVNQDKTKLNINLMELFAIIVFKNILPQEFSDFQKRKGFVYDLFNLRPEILELLRKKLEEIYAVENERAGKSTELTDMQNELIKEEVNKNKNIQIKMLLANCSQWNIKILEEFFLSKKEYCSENIKNCNDDNFKLLKSLIVEGLINENYEDYLSYFYEGSLSIKDKNFLRAILEDDGYDFGYELIEINEIINNIRPEWYSRHGVLNFNLVEYILLSIHDSYGNNQENQNERNLDLIFAQFKNSEILKNDFFSEFMRRIIKNIDNEQKEDEDSKKLNKIIATIKRIANKNEAYQLLLEKDIEKYYGYNEIIIDILLKEQLITFNFNNIKFLLENYSNKGTIKNISNEDLLTKNYSLISEVNNTLFEKCIKENLDNYMRNMLDWCGEKVNDNEETVLKILKNNSISETNKLKYISYMQNKITEFERIDKLLFYALLENNRIAISKDFNKKIKSSFEIEISDIFEDKGFDVTKINIDSLIAILRSTEDNKQEGYDYKNNEVPITDTNKKAIEVLLDYLVIRNYSEVRYTNESNIKYYELEV